MTKSSTHTPPRPMSESTALATFAAAMALADAWLVAWLLGSVWGMALAAGTILGLMTSTAWAIRLYVVSASMALLLMTVGLAIVLARCSQTAAILGAMVAVGIFAVRALRENDYGL